MALQESPKGRFASRDGLTKDDLSSTNLLHCSMVLQCGTASHPQLLSIRTYFDATSGMQKISACLCAGTIVLTHLPTYLGPFVPMRTSSLGL
jgi:hypothetical protein